MARFTVKEAWAFSIWSSLRSIACKMGRPLAGRAPAEASPSVDQRLIDERVDHLPVLPADAAGRLRHPHDDQFLARIDPPVGPACTRPGEIANRAQHAHNPRRGADRNAETEPVVAAGGVAGLADQVAH